MTANELGLQIKIQYEKLDTAGAPGIQDSVLSRVATNAQLFVAASRLNSLANKLSLGVEETELRGEGLSELLTTATILPQPPSVENVPGGTFFQLPPDFWLTVYENVTIDKNNCTTSTPITGFVRAVPHSELFDLMQNDFKKPYYNTTYAEVLRLFYSRSASGYNSSFVSVLNPTTNPTYNPTIDNGYDYLTTQTPKRHELVTDGSFTITNYFIRYYRMPRVIIIDSLTPQNQRHPELDEFMQLSIIETAVAMLKQSLDDNRPSSISYLNVT